MCRIAVAVAVPMALAVAAPAQAVITTSAITSPADNSTQLVTGVGPTFTPAALTVSGTSNGTTGDMIQIRAYRGTAPLEYDTTGGPGVAVESDGDWSTSIANTQASSTFPYGGVRLYAVPPGAPDALPDSADFQPVRVTGERRVTAVHSGLPGDLWFIHTGTQGFFDVYGVGSCGVCDTALYDTATHSRGNYLWYGAGLYNTEDEYGAPRGYLRVDGRNAMFPSGIRSGNLEGNAGLEPISVAFTHGAEPSVTGVEPALRCANATPFPPQNNTDCGTLSDTGVQNTMTVQSANGGRRQIVTHRFASTDGGAHDVDAHMTAYLRIPSGVNPQFQMQWLPDGFATPFAGQTFPGPPGAGTVLVRQNSTVPNGSMEFPAGALTISPAPQFIQFMNDTPTAEFIMPYRATVSPGNDLVVHQQFDTEPSLALAQAAGAAARTRLAPPPAVPNQPPAVTSPDVVKPRLRLSRVPSRVKLKTLRKSGIAFRATCNEACSLDASLLARVRRATLARAGDLTLGTKRAKRGTGTRRLRLKVSRRLRSSLRRGRRVRVSVTATDAAGNRSTATKRVRIR